MLTCSLVLALPGCSRSEFEDRTAVVSVDGRPRTFDVVSCGLDGTTVFVVGRSEDGSVLQAVVGVVAPDRLDGLVVSTAVTVGTRGEEFAASGSEAWERRGLSGRPPGVITSARIRGSRVQVAGDVEPVATDGTSTPAASVDEVLPFSLDARCDQVAP